MRGDLKTERSLANRERQGEKASALGDPVGGNAGGCHLGAAGEVRARSATNGKAIGPGSRAELRKIAMLGNHLPRQCGIATFTADLSEAISTECPRLECFVLAMNEAGQRYAYPERVRFEISAPDIASYRRAADFLNIGPVDLVSVQHEYGIFGGKAGGHLLALLRELRMPVVTTLHTILAEPNAHQRSVMDELTSVSERLVVMSDHGAELLGRVHDVPAAKIDVIPHGIPNIPFQSDGKRQLGVEGKWVILTFGLLSPDKGIEHVIDALPAVLERHPQTVYIVVGATHPHVKEHGGELYRVMLENRAQRLGVDSSMIFHNRFVSKDELNEFLSAADIYITPYLKPEQITSGTLAYAVGSGKAVISTPYSYAREVLAEGRGILVPWKDPQAIATAVIGLLDDGNKRLALRQRAAAYGKRMLWPQVARLYVDTFERARLEHAERLRSVFRAKTLAERPLDLPEINLEHLQVLSDQTGILQHAAFNVPRYEDGYCLDDNARALLLTTLLQEAGVEDARVLRSLGGRYLAFVSHAFDADTQRFRNFMSYSRRWLEAQGSEDGHGRALWALGTVVSHSGDMGRRALADSLFHSGLSRVGALTSPRAWAYALLGIDEYLRAFEGDSRIQTTRGQVAERLLGLYQRTSTAAWPWFEVQATYCNARLSQALLTSASWMEHREMKTAALASLEWLASVQRTTDGYFAPIGSDGFYSRGGAKAAFDQQPVEAHSMVSACLCAHRVTGEARWALEARRAFNWFLGQNQLQQSVYDPATGGCRDGLHTDRPNENQGAESTLSFLLALVEMRTAAQTAQPRPTKSVVPRPTF